MDTMQLAEVGQASDIMLYMFLVFGLPLVSLALLGVDRLTKCVLRRRASP